MIECNRCGSDLTWPGMAHECGTRTPPPLSPPRKPEVDNMAAMLERGTLRYVPEKDIYVYQGGKSCD
jgi:hypothetical protein